MNIAVLLSGGVDSSVAVHLLNEQGYRPSLFYIRISSDEAGTMDCSMEEDVEICQSVSRRYGLPFELVDLHHQYWDEVVGYMMEKLRQGFTPNSDVMCNRLIKFGCFERQIGQFFDATATGHYAQIIDHEGTVWLGTAVDTLKDQTDFLAQVDELQLSRTLFPIGGLMKSEVRRIAETAHLVASRRKDSQGICFLGKTHYPDLVRRYLGIRKGDVIEKETGRRIGYHQGYWFYTIGQRKGLGFSGGPWYCSRKGYCSERYLCIPWLRYSLAVWPFIPYARLPVYHSSSMGRQCGPGRNQFQDKACSRIFHRKTFCLQ